QALLDAELVGGAEGAYLWIGDVLHVDGRDACPLPFRERRALLERLPLDGPRWRLAPVFPAAGAEVLAAAEHQKLPYVVAKDPDAPYEPGRTSTRWVQVATGVAAPESPPRASGTRAGFGRAALSNPGKVLYPLTGTTKSDVLAYYLAVADVMLPHL